MTAPVGSASDTSPSPTLPRKPGQSHVEILDSNRACESAAGFQSCAHDPISIPMLRPFAENWPHAIALPTRGEGTHRDCRSTGFRANTALIQPGVIRNVPAPDDPSLPDRLRPHTSLAEIRVA